MHNPGNFYNGTATVFSTETNLPQKPFFEKLYRVSTEKCTEYVNPDSATTMRMCRNEIMVAASCVLLSKTNNQYGDWRNNVRICNNEINIVCYFLLRPKVIKKGKLKIFLNIINYVRVNKILYNFLP